MEVMSLIPVLIKFQGMVFIYTQINPGINILVYLISYYFRGQTTSVFKERKKNETTVAYCGLLPIMCQHCFADMAADVLLFATDVNRAEI